MLNDREACFWLGGIRTLSPAGRQKLLEILGSPLALHELSDGELLQLVNEDLMKPETMEEIRDTRDEDLVRKKEREVCRSCRYTTLADQDYPELLREIPDPPVTLFYRGDLKILRTHPTLGVVGSRAHSEYGKSMVGRFVPALVTAGVVIISGLAMGIDTEAHFQTVLTLDRLRKEGRLPAEVMREQMVREDRLPREEFPFGKTVGVLGGGVDICYPLRNYNLYDEMCRNHLVVSEYPPGTAPLAPQFPLRNRIISGLSRGLLVVEARKRSGTLITADAALDQGRNVYAVPGRIGDPLSEGTNNLIRQGAMLVQTPEDILEDLGISGKNAGKRKDKEKALKKSLSAEERRIYEKLSYVPMYIDELLSDDSIDVPEGLRWIISLEQKGLIRQPMQGYYVREK